jgi:hypothetical protein
MTTLVIFRQFASRKCLLQNIVFTQLLFNTNSPLKTRHHRSKQVRAVKNRPHLTKGGGSLISRRKGGGIHFLSLEKEKFEEIRVKYFDYFSGYKAKKKPPKP